jgi:hypothetical protein
MPDQRLDTTSGAADTRRLSAPEIAPGPRRAAERHYVAVVAAEARRLARQLRPPSPGRAGPRMPTSGNAGAEVMP